MTVNMHLDGFTGHPVCILVYISVNMHQGGYASHPVCKM